MAGSRKARIRTVAVVVRPDSQAVARRARQVGAWLERHGVSVVGEAAWISPACESGILSRAEMMRKADLVVVLGGDGSLIGVARLSYSSPVPVIGFHHGDFGFLTGGDRSDVYSTLERILAGEYSLEHRTLLAVSVYRGGRRVFRSQALNDAVVSHGRVSRLVELDVSVDGQHLASYKGDGLVVATPTGSTAYSLSAGGPVVEPTMGAILITPISAHTLSLRPLVVPDRSSIRVCVPADSAGSDGAVLTLDGQEWFALEAGDEVRATKSRNRAAIVRGVGEGFFDVLRRKLHWGARGEG